MDRGEKKRRLLPSQSLLSVEDSITVAQPATLAHAPCLVPVDLGVGDTRLLPGECFLECEEAERLQNFVPGLEFQNPMQWGG